MTSFPWGFREGHPTRLDLLVTALAGALTVEAVLTAESLAVEWIAVGFVLTLVAVGPVASSRVGARIGDLARSSNLPERLAVAAAVVALFWGASFVVDPSTLPVNSVTTGTFAAVAVFGVLEWVASRVGTDR